SDFGLSMLFQPPPSTIFSAARGALKGYGWALGERTKHKIPESKHQTPNTREAPSSTFQAPRSAGRGLELGTWDLFGVWSLVFGVLIPGSNSRSRVQAGPRLPGKNLPDDILDGDLLNIDVGDGKFVQQRLANSDHAVALDLEFD